MLLPVRFRGKPLVGDDQRVLLRPIYLEHRSDGVRTEPAYRSTPALIGLVGNEHWQIPQFVSSGSGRFHT